jgi:hypothetical protein
MGLQVDSTCCVIFFIVLVFWVASGMLAGDRHERSILKWKSIFLSFFGFAWLDFGIIYIFRFFALLYDPVLFNATQFPMWEVPNHILSKTFLYLGVYWFIFCIGMVITKRAVPRGLPKFLKTLTLIEFPGNFQSLDLLTAICIFSIVLVNGPWGLIPGMLLTPVGIVGSLWVIAPTIAWYFHFRGLKVSLKRRLLYLIPGITVFLLSPFREHLLNIVLCLLIPVLLTKPRFKLVRVAGLLSVFLLVSSIVLYIYRPYYWDDKSLEEASEYASWTRWQEKPRQAPWIRLINRFSGFDASALTVFLVPSIFPYEDRNIVTEFLWTAFIPRAVNWEKSIKERGRSFSTSIWSYTERGQILNRESAPIAPSMFGDLWSSGGLRTVILGALIWGILIGILECWKRVLTPGAAVVLIVFLATRIGGGMERDFIHATSTIIQSVIVLLVFVPVIRRKIVWTSPRPRFGQRVP